MTAASRARIHGARASSPRVSARVSAMASAAGSALGRLRASFGERTPEKAEALPSPSRSI
jgi:hypothetical protein